MLIWQERSDLVDEVGRATVLRSDLGEGPPRRLLLDAGEDVPVPGAGGDPVGLAQQLFGPAHPITSVSFSAARVTPVYIQLRQVSRLNQSLKRRTSSHCEPCDLWTVAQ